MTSGPGYTDVRVNDLNLTLGLNIDLGAAWKLSLYGNYAQERENQFNGGQVDQAALAAALADPDPATAFNPFGDGSNTNPATLRSLPRAAVSIPTRACEPPTSRRTAPSATCLAAPSSSPWAPITATRSLTRSRPSRPCSRRAGRA